MTSREKLPMSRRGFLKTVPTVILGAAGLQSATLTMLAADTRATPGQAGPSARGNGRFSWGPGPRSGLPWWSGGWSALEELEALRTDPLSKQVRGIDQVLVYARNGGWRKISTLFIDEHSSNHIWLTRHACPSLNIAFRAWPSALKEDADKGAWQKHVVADWPADFGSKPEHWDTWMSPRIPVGWKPGMDDTTGRALAVEVWRKAADGYFNRMWESVARSMKKSYLDRYGLEQVRLIFRPFWECNNKCEVGKPHAINSSSFACCETDEEIGAARAGQEQCIRAIKRVFPGALVHWCPLKKGKTSRNVELYCPENTDIIGPDYYDNYPSSLTQVEWDKNVVATGVEGGPVGLQRWLDFCKRRNKPLGIGEWGIGADTAEPAEAHGGDNPLFVRNMFAFFESNRDWIAYEAYFNSAAHRLNSLTKPANPAASAAYRVAFSRLPDVRRG